MVTLKLSIVAGELGRRIRDRLRGAGSITSARVVWEQSGQQLLIHTDSVLARFVDGWLVCNVDLQTDETQRQTLQFVYFLGKADDGDGPQAAATINAPTPQAAQLAAAWGADVQRVIWDAILDAIEAGIHRAAGQHSGQKLTLQGFYSAGDGFHVQVLAGDI